MDIAINVKVTEAFLEFEEASDTSANELENEILVFLNVMGSAMTEWPIWVVVMW